ncbi:gap junction alpha-3 protein-like [Pelmatolapia mariae]|uniref:gap junction alpha-3 protein-like n=1 Tax=Pelmatolapia mariae TaxID=158779 RepID=UPI002FE609AA
MTNQKSGFLSSVLCKWHAQATLIGKYLLPVLLLIRFVMLGAAVQTVWLNDREEFLCSTQQPGCEVTCFDAVTPLSLPRLWTLQLVLVLAPGLVFLCYLIHLTNQETQVRNSAEGVKGHTLAAYRACVVFVILVEVGCIVAQWCLYGFKLSTDFSCGRSPCPMRVDCFLPRAWDKTVFLRIMFTASSMSILLNVVEAVCMLRAKLRRTDGGETLQSGSEVEESVLSRLLALWHSHAGFLGKIVLPVLQLVQIVLVGAAVQPLWSHDLKYFVCDTDQRACSREAYNFAFPFSWHQYWTLQVVFVLAPGLIYFSYLVYLLVTQKQSETGTVIKRQTLWAYLGFLSAVVLLELGFAVGQCLNYGVLLPSMFRLYTRRCVDIIKCYFSQPTEKSVFMIIMLVLALLSVLLTLVEMCMVLKTKKPWKKREDNRENSIPCTEMMSNDKEEGDA